MTHHLVPAAIPRHPESIRVSILLLAARLQFAATVVDCGARRPCRPPIRPAAHTPPWAWSRPLLPATRTTSASATYTGRVAWSSAELDLANTRGKSSATARCGLSFLFRAWTRFRDRVVAVGCGRKKKFSRQLAFDWQCPIAPIARPRGGRHMIGEIRRKIRPRWQRTQIDGYFLLV